MDRLAQRQEFRRLSMRAGLAFDPTERQALRASADALYRTLHGAAPGEKQGFSGTVIALLVEGDEAVTYDDGDSAPLHCTIVFLGDTANLNDVDRLAILNTARAISALIDPFEAQVVSAAEFGDTPVWIVEHEDIQAARVIAEEDPTVGALRDANDEHPTFLPHVSGLGDRDTVRFDRVAAMIGGENTIYALGETTQTPDLDDDTQSQGVLT
jgi:hypothetical protein